jgi:hypothetical protein
MAHCNHCNTEFEPKNTRQIYCKASCKVSAWQKKKGIAKPDFLQPKKSEHIDGSGAENKFEVIIKQREISKSVENPKYSEKANELNYYKNEIQKLGRKKHRLLQNREELLTYHQTALGIVGGISAGLVAKDWAIGFFSAVGGYLLGKMAKKAEMKANIDHINRIDDNLTLIDRDIVIVNNYIYRLSYELISIPKQLKHTITEDYKTFALKEAPELAPMLTALPPIQINVKQRKLTVKKAENIVTLEDFKNQKIPTLDFSDSEYGELFGNPAPNFLICIYGTAGNGKSTKALRLAEYLSKKHGKVLYNSSEEGFQASMQNKIKNIDAPYFDIANIRTFEELTDLLSKNSSFRFVFIDSINDMNITPEQLLELRQNNSKRGFVIIMQATKAGNYKGDSAFGHDADVVMKLENYLPVIEKTRFR